MRNMRHWKWSSQNFGTKLIGKNIKILRLKTSAQWAINQKLSSSEENTLTRCTIYKKCK